MQYKTIVIELLKDHPELYQELTASNSLLSTTDQLASQLRENHQAILAQMQEREPSQSKLLLSSEALEIALSQLQESLPAIETDEITGTFSLDAAMAFLKRNTPNA